MATSSTSFAAATPAQELLARGLMRVNSFLAKWQQRVDAAKEALCEAILATGGEGIQGNTWKATYKRTKSSEKVNWEAVARCMAAAHNDYNGLETAKAANTETKDGGYRFLLTPIGSSSSAVNSGK